MSKIKRKREFLKDLENFRSFKKHREEFYSETIIKSENEKETVKDSIYSLREKTKIPDSKIENERLDDLKTRLEESELENRFKLSKPEINYNFHYNNNQFLEINKLNADININVEESDVEYMKVIQNGKLNYFNTNKNMKKLIIFLA